MTAAWTLALVSTGSTLTPGLAAMVEWCALMLPTKVSDGKCTRLISAIFWIIRPISDYRILNPDGLDNPPYRRLLRRGSLFLSDFSDGGYYFMGEPRDA